MAIAEKDYFLAIVLQIIYSSKLKDKLVFKGGTAIHHLYLDQLRFSEDLDFSATEPVTIEEVAEAFRPFAFLKIVKHFESDFSLKIQRLKFAGPLGQPNSIKIDIDQTQKLILPTEKASYVNTYGVPVTVSAMAVREICAEKVRAVNERARYRDFYDLAMVLKENSFGPQEIMKILNQKELRKPVSRDSIIANLEIAEEARRSGSESLYYRKEISLGEIGQRLKGLLDLL